MSPPPQPLQKQDRDVALPRLVQEFGSKLYHISLRMCRTPEEAEDLVQEIFLQAWRNWSQFEGRSKVGTWLYTIAARACQRKHRKRSGEPDQVFSLDDGLPTRETRTPVIPGGNDPKSAALRSEAIVRVQEAIAALPADFRLPIVFKEILGLSLAEVAEALGVKAETVKTRLHRARLQLRRALISGLPQRDVPMPSYSQQVCLDLLEAKQEALDRGSESFPVGERTISERCQAVADSLDLTQAACRTIADGKFPERLQRRLLDSLRTKQEGTP